MSTTLFPVSLLHMFEQVTVDAAALRPTLAACQTTLADLVGMEKQTGYQPDADRYQPEADLHRRLSVADWELVHTALKLAIMAGEAHRSLCVALTHLVALYPQMQVYQRLLGLLLDDTTLPDDWLDHDPEAAPAYYADAPEPVEVG